jgi:hypothetical protein
MFEKGFELIEQAIQVAEIKQPAWKSFPRSAKVRMELLKSDIRSAEKTMGNARLQATSIPYARYTIFVCLANIELAVAKREFHQALALSEELLYETSPLTRVDIPEVLRWKAFALMGLGRLNEAYQTLTDACSLAKKTDSNLHLWLILSNLAEVNSILGDDTGAEANREEARGIVGQIAESLREVGLRDLFLDQARVQTLIP